ncbi:MAG: hypothetical protein LQ343_003309 [Gyalolechia ehrenbergii]|nr:MAG: hypothetical protein LQ343_003309 [Gyalolechia ehrenbergii]
MQRTPFNNSLIKSRELFQLPNLRPLNNRELRYGASIRTQWVCHRCQSRLARAIPPARPIIRTRSRFPSKEILQFSNKSTFSSTSRQNDSPLSTKPDESPSKTQPSSSPHLPSHTESLRSPLSRRLTKLLDSLQNSTLSATQHLNTLTGYTGIESLKTSITAQEAHLQHARSALASARTAYTSAINNRSASQREVNSLLQRKHAWSPADLERFTELYRSDHANELQETQAHATLMQAEKEAEDAGAKLSESILKRYHEEQIWSDKIRRMSTWGTWGLMGVNVLLFLVFQLGLEPWRRGRLVRGFEEKVREALEEGRSIDLKVNVQGSGAGDARVDWEMGTRKEVDGVVQEKVVERGESVGGGEGNQVETFIEGETEREAAKSSEVESQIDREIEEEILSEKGQMVVLKDKVKDLFSDQQVVVRRWDLTALALEGAAVGMALAGLIALLLRPR